MQWQELDPGAKALLAFVVVGPAALALWRQRRAVPLSVPPPSPPTPLPGNTAWPEPTLPILPAADVLVDTDTGAALNALQIASGLNDPTWSKYCRPVVDQVLELMQRLPSSESHHHAEPGGLWIHSLETATISNRLRQGRLLPAGRDTEDVSRHRHRWTAGIIIAALCHDAGKVVTDLRVRLYGPKHPGSPWNATSSAMTTTGATAYAVDFPAATERAYDAHQRLGAMLLQRLAPPDTLTWLGEDPPLLRAMLAYLGNEAAPDNEVADIVRRAEVESVRRNLLSGPRTRFATARTVPLIERLMAALRRMLAEGGRLPLNRPGATGYVFEGDLWFASQHLANEVRQYLNQHESGAGIPGEDKNDRLYDVWQEYGACRINPDTGGAIWGARFELPDRSYDLPGMLRFPLEQLFAAPTSYPAPMPGRIVPLARTTNSPGATPTAVAKPAHSPPETLTLAPAATKPAAADAMQAPAAPPKVVAPSARTVSDAAPAKVDAAFEPAEFLPDALCAGPARPAAPPSLSARPVSPAVKVPKRPGERGQPEKKPPSEAALRFMGWLQAGLGDATLPYNQTKALVHFVRYETDEIVMLLVSPAIFRRFAQEYPEIAQAQGEAGDHLGMGIQRAFAKADWHIRSPAGKNVFRYQVMRNGDKGGNLLNGFLVREPERFVNPVPPANDRLVCWNDDPVKA